ncbi:MAG: biopolymer transporter ExbD [Gammaproteobacteria bacterium]|jgi:biopolymer transport protein ExbD|nr:biopolymer transporter ExbD [Gammaproteobacteria bacterium]
MAKRKHYRRSDKEPAELEITTFLNLMVILIPFMLINAVFSRVNILELDLPVSSGSSSVNQPILSVEVIVRAQAIEVGNGQGILVSIPKEDDKYDLKKLSAFLVELKAKVPDKLDATVLMEPDIQYDNLVHVMDAVRTVEVRKTGEELVQKIELFPNISVGDAPQ